MRRRQHAVQLVTDLVGPRLVGHRIAVLGAAFKPDSDDLRDSPALDIALTLWSRGADVVIHDPEAGQKLRQQRPDLDVVDTIDEALTGAEVTMLLTEWKQFREMDPETTRNLVKSPVIVDGRNVLDPKTWTEAGREYHGIGRAVSEW